MAGSMFHLMEGKEDLSQKGLGLNLHSATYNLCDLWVSYIRFLILTLFFFLLFTEVKLNYNVNYCCTAK